MTLPRGFGSGEGTCTNCGERKRYGECETQDCKQNPNYGGNTIIPVSKFNIGQGLYFFFFFSGVFSLVYVVVIFSYSFTDMLLILYGIFTVLLSNIIAWMWIDDGSYHYREGRMRSTFFWIVPLINRAHKYEFKD